MLHFLSNIYLFLLDTSVICGADNWVAIEAFGEATSIGIGISFTLLITRIVMLFSVTIRPRFCDFYTVALWVIYFLITGHEIKLYRVSINSTHYLKYYQG